MTLYQDFDKIIPFCISLVITSSIMIGVAVWSEYCIDDTVEEITNIEYEIDQSFTDQYNNTFYLVHTSTGERHIVITTETNVVIKEYWEE